MARPYPDQDQVEGGGIEGDGFNDYGKAGQSYIIDGSGVYVTRNRDTYAHGMFELSDNVAYENGINGVVVRAARRGPAAARAVVNWHAGVDACSSLASAPSFGRRAVAGSQDRPRDC